MPSFYNHTRNFTFPPQVHLLNLSLSQPSPQQPADLPDIDEEPFAHFISPVTEEDDPYDAYKFSAGIDLGDTPITAKEHKFRNTVTKKWNQYIASHHSSLHKMYQRPLLQHNPSLPKIEEPSEEDSPLLERDPPRSDSPMQDPATTNTTRPYKVEIRVPSIPMPPREPTLGHAQDLLASSRRKRGRRSRRHMAGRRHSWREPSPDLFTVLEEQEPKVVGEVGEDGEQTDDGFGRRSQTERDGVWWVQKARL